MPAPIIRTSGTSNQCRVLSTHPSFMNRPKPRYCIVGRAGRAGRPYVFAQGIQGRTYVGEGSGCGDGGRSPMTTKYGSPACPGAGAGGAATAGASTAPG